jgi:hypothetical protein
MPTFYFSFSTLCIQYSGFMLEMPLEVHLFPNRMGSFDSAWLPPRYAQDDKGGEKRASASVPFLLKSDD